jgi:hypothetical protein
MAMAEARKSLGRAERAHQRTSRRSALSQAEIDCRPKAANVMGPRLEAGNKQMPEQSCPNFFILHHVVSKTYGLFRT